MFLELELNEFQYSWKGTKRIPNEMKRTVTEQMRIVTFCSVYRGFVPLPEEASLSFAPLSSPLQRGGYAVGVFHTEIRSIESVVILCIKASVLVINAL